MMLMNAKRLNWNQQKRAGVASPLVFGPWQLRGLGLTDVSLVSRPPYRVSPLSQASLLPLIVPRVATYKSVGREKESEIE